MEDYVPLSPNWITEGTIDLEYKSYLLLAYLKRVDKKFSSLELYPPLKDVIDQYKSLIKLKNGQQEIFDKAQKNPLKIDLKELKIIYEGLSEKEGWMEEIQRILEFSIPKIQSKIETGKTIYEELENQVKIEPVGIIPIDQSQGFIFLRGKNEQFVDVFQFRIKKLEYEGNPIKGIYTRFLESLKKGFATLENIKTMLVDKYPLDTSPMAFFVNTDYWLPRDETLMPITKRKILALAEV